MTARLLGGLVLVFALFHGIAAWLGSDRGQWGLVVAAIVIAVTAMYERFVLAPKTPTVLPALGRPHARGMLAAAAVSAALMAVPLAAASIAGWTPGLENGITW